jgi:hypothetical protein
MFEARWCDLLLVWIQTLLNNFLPEKKTRESNARHCNCNLYTSVDSVLISCLSSRFKFVRICPYVIFLCLIFMTIMFDMSKALTCVPNLKKMVNTFNDFQNARQSSTANRRWKVWWWTCRCGHITSLNCGHQRAYCSSPMWYMSTESYGGMISTGNSWFFHQSSLEILPAESTSSIVGGAGEGNDKFCLTKYFFYTSKGSLTCRKILRHGTDGFTSSPK